MNAEITTGLFGPRNLSTRTRILIYVPVGLISLLALWVAIFRPYTAGSDFGYYLGLVGGLMMASLLLYPLRKHWRRLENFGSMRAWFIYHVIVGISGPILVLFHSTFETHAFNSTIALWAMLVVLASGIVGRFIFTRLYQGLEGKKASLEEMETFLTKCEDEAQHALDLAPGVRKLLEDYRKHILDVGSFSWDKLMTFLAIGWHGEIVIASARKQVYAALEEEARLKEWPRSRYLAEKNVFDVLIEDYVEAIDITSRYTYWERLLAWWQLAHVPLVYVLLITAIIHVVAVHTY